MCEGQFASVSPPPVQEVESIIVTFNIDASVEVTDRVACTDPAPGPEGCHFLPALSALSAQGLRSYRLTILPTATDAEVRQVMDRLDTGPHVKSVRVVERQV
jgi:hypothetical protein